MPSRSDLEIKSRLFLGLGLLGIVAILLLRILLPLLLIIGFGAGAFWLWQQYRKKKQRQQRQQARINAKFYQLLRQQQGRISVLDFAIRTQLDGAAAQAYLNTQAQAFSAFFETTPQGDLIYVFGAVAGHGERYQAQAETAWAYEQQARSQARSQAQQSHAAWNNAKQIRTMRQLLHTQPTATHELATHELATHKSKPSNGSHLAVKDQTNSLVAPSSPSSLVAPDSSVGSRVGASVGSSGFINVELKANAKNEGIQANKSNTKPNKSTGTKAGQKAVVKLPKESGYPESKTAMNQAASDQSPIVRGRAYDAADRVVTIDVTAEVTAIKS